MKFQVCFRYLIVISLFIGQSFAQVNTATVSGSVSDSITRAAGAPGAGPDGICSTDGESPSGAARGSQGTQRERANKHFKLYF